MGFTLSVLCWRRIRGLWKLPDKRDMWKLWAIKVVGMGLCIILIMNRLIWVIINLSWFYYIFLKEYFKKIPGIKKIFYFQILKVIILFLKPEHGQCCSQQRRNLIKFIQFTLFSNTNHKSTDLFTCVKKNFTWDRDVFKVFIHLNRNEDQMHVYNAITCDLWRAVI